MNKKDILMELVYDIPTLIKMQEITIRELKNNFPKQIAIDFQEDVLKVLKSVAQMEIIDLDMN